MKKFAILLIIILACVLVAGCAMDSVTYCPYCKSNNIEEKETGIYKCKNCDKTFGAKEITS